MNIELDPNKKMWKDELDDLLTENYPLESARDLIRLLITELLKKQRVEIEREIEKENETAKCDVLFCKNEVVAGGTCWRETGYWSVCSKHSDDHRDGKPQPKMKQKAVDREKKRNPETGYLHK